MKVLHVFYELKFSGAEIMYYTAAPIFKDQGVEMVVLSTGPNLGEFASQFQSLAIDVYHKPLENGKNNPMFLFKYFREVLRFIRDQNVNVIHIHRSPYYIFFSLIGFILNIRTVRTVHNVFRNRFLTRPKAIVERFIARKLFGIKFQTIGESVYSHELTYYKNPSIRVNNWYSSEKFYPLSINETKQSKRVEIGIPPDSYVIISTGGCSSIKNHHDIIRALAIVNKRIKCIYLHLGSGKTENEEIMLSKELGVYDDIRFLSNKTNVRDYLVSSDIFVMTSKFEGLSIASIEAMACGLPSILYNSPGLRDLISNDDNGFLINPSYKLLADKILYLYDHPTVAEKFGTAARSYVGENYSIEQGASKILQLCYR